MRPERSGSRALAIGCIVAWFVAAFATRWLGQWIALGGIAVLLALVSLVVDRLANLRLFEGLWPRDPRGWATAIAAGLVGGVGMTVATYALYQPVVRLAPMFFHDVTHLYGAFVKLPPWLAVVVLVPIICSEELVWRGAVQTTMNHNLSAPAAAALAAVVYSLAHAPTGSPVLVLAALGCGIVWSALRGLTGSFVAPIIAHLVWDFSVLLLHPLAPPILPP